MLNLSLLKDLLIAPVNRVEPSLLEVDHLMRRFRHLEVNFALTYLVGLLAKLELAALLDPQHLLVPALIPLRRLADAKDVPSRQVG